MNSTIDAKIIIIGAGVTGLALAQGLKKSGIAFDVYERAPSPTSKRNWCFGIHWGFDALKELVPEHFLNTLDAARIDPHIDSQDESLYRLPLYDAASGKLIKELPGSRFHRLRRDKFRDWLLQDIETNVHWGKSPSQLEYSEDENSVAVTFEDGSVANGAMVIGCDGARSKVRELLLGREDAALQPIGDFATATIYSKHTREHALQLRARPYHPLYQIGLHQKGFVSWLCVHNAEDKDHPEDWTFFNYTSYRLPPGVDQSQWSKADLIRYQKSIVKENDFVDPFKSIYSWLSDDEENVWYTRLMDWDPRSPDHAWDNRKGRITLAGDAAHPMSFQRGQGLNNALQDALELRNAIASVWKDDDVQATARKNALNAYEEQMIERGGKEVQLSRENTFMVHGENFQNSHLATKGLNAEGQA